METIPTQHSGRDFHKVFEVLKTFDNLMLLTFERTGPTPVGRARPMAVAKLDPDCTLWFITSVTSSKVDETLNAHHHAQVIGQAGARQISLAGKLDILRDPARIEQMWSKMYEAWFPNGPKDPDVCLLRFTPAEAELWDSSGLKGLKYWFQSARAVLTGEKPVPDKEQHARVELDDN